MALHLFLLQFLPVAVPSGTVAPTLLLLRPLDTTGKLLHRAEAMRSSAMLMESLDEEWVVDMGGEYLDTPTVWLFAGALHRKT